MTQFLMFAMIAAIVLVLTWFGYAVGYANGKDQALLEQSRAERGEDDESS